MIYKLISVTTSVAFASESQGNIEEMFPLYYKHSCMFESSTIHLCDVRCERVLMSITALMNRRGVISVIAFVECLLTLLQRVTHNHVNLLNI